MKEMSIATQTKISFIIFGVLIIGLPYYILMREPTYVPPELTEREQIESDREWHKANRQREAEYNATVNKDVALRIALSYLSEIPEVAWYICEDNNVYIGFKSYPYDGLMILKGVALRGNNAIRFGCHVWGVPSNQRSNPPYFGTMSGKWYDETTARYGRIR